MWLQAGTQDVNFLYSLAWIDLTGGPLVVNAPDTGGRFYELQFVDIYNEIPLLIGGLTSLLIPNVSTTWNYANGKDWCSKAADNDIKLQKLFAIPTLTISRHFANVPHICKPNNRCSLSLPLQGGKQFNEVVKSTVVN